MEMDKSVPGANQSANMYSYQDDQKNPYAESGAIRRSIGEGNPNAVIENQINNINTSNNERAIGQNSIIIQIGQTPPLYWMLFIIFGIIQIIFIILLANYYDWYILNKPNNIFINNISSKEKINEYYRLFQEINIMIFLGFGFLRSFLKHHSWTSIGITFLAGVLSLEFGLFTLICWSSIFKRKWEIGIFNFQFLLDSSYCSATIVISLGAVLGKLSLPQYLVMIFIETIFATLNYILLRLKMKIIDVGGALTVHLFGAMFGGVFSLVSFVTRNERERIRTSPHLGSSYNSNIFALFGTLILIAYWPSFNTSLIIDDIDKYRGVINTYLAILGSIVGTFCISPLCNLGKIQIKDILNSCFCGGIVVAGSCHIIDKFWASIIIGVISGGLTTYLSNILSDRLKRMGYHDTSDIIYYHGIPGFLGGIITTIFVGKEGETNEKIEKKILYNYVGKIMNNNIIGISGTRNISEYAGVHFAAIFITMAIGISSGFFAGFIIKFCNCNIAIRYFNDSEYFDIRDNETFPWYDEKVEFQQN